MQYLILNRHRQLFLGNQKMCCKFVTSIIRRVRITISDAIRQAAPLLQVAAIEASVVNSETTDELWHELTTETGRIASTYEIGQINKREGIAATRKAYKTLGKEPNRYRPSSEALCRRAAKGMELYRINTLVDLINIVSMRSGYSIGGFDADKIAGDTLCLGVGEDGEEFEAIGRGQLNIAHMPVYRDAIGGIGTPTSDIERTKLSLYTRHLLMCINIYGEEMPVDDTIDYTIELLNKYCQAQDITVTLYKP